MSVAHQFSDYSAPSQGWRGGTAARVAELLDKGIAEGLTRGGVVLAAQHGRFTVQLSRGSKVAPKGESKPGALSLDSVFDLGGLTGAVCTATLLMRLISAGKVGVLDRASRFVQALGVGQKSNITLAHLLAHVAGFGPSLDVYGELVRANEGPRPGILGSSGGRNYAYQIVRKAVPRYTPGSRHLRSNTNYILLGEICEIVTGMSLEKAFARFVAGPLELRSLNFIDLTLVRNRNVRPMLEVFAPVGECSRRGRFVCGEVWDESAWAMGGVAGHSGLFGTADDLLVWASEILCALKGKSEMISAEVATAFAAPRIEGFEPHWRLGFDSGEGESLVAASETGCSVLIDQRRDIAGVVLLSGGPVGAASKKFAALRADIHAALVDTEV